MGIGKYFWDVNISDLFFCLNQNFDLFRQIYFDPSFLFPFLVLLPTLSSFFPKEFRLANFPGKEESFIWKEYCILKLAVNFQFPKMLVCRYW